MTASLEDRSLDRLVRHLVAQGRSVSIVSRPDRGRHSGRAVDAELEIDSVAIGVEITQMIQAPRAWREIVRFESAVAAALAPDLNHRGLGILISLSYLPLPSKKALRDAAVLFADAIARAIAGWNPRVAGRVSLDPGIEFVSRVEVSHEVGDSAGCAWASDTHESGGWIAPIADAFVDHLIESKATQGSEYAELGILVVDRDGLVDAKQLGAALARRSDCPTSWKRVWLEPVTDGVSVIDVSIGVTERR